VQRGSLYNAYGDKERLFLLAYERYSSQFLDSVRLALSNPDPVVALTTLFKGVVVNMSEGAPSRGCLTTKTALELPIAGKAIEARVRQLLEDFTALIRDALSTPAARRKLSCDPSIAADLVVTFTRGLAVMEPRLSQSPASGKDVGAIRAHPVAGRQAPPRRMSVTPALGGATATPRGIIGVHEIHRPGAERSINFIMRSRIQAPVG